MSDRQNGSGTYSETVKMFVINRMLNADEDGHGDVTSKQCTVRATGGFKTRDKITPSSERYRSHIINHGCTPKTKKTRVTLGSTCKDHQVITKMIFSEGNFCHTDQC